MEWGVVGAVEEVRSHEEWEPGRQGPQGCFPVFTLFMYLRHITRKCNFSASLSRESSPLTLVNAFQMDEQRFPQMRILLNENKK